MQINSNLKRIQVHYLLSAAALLGVSLVEGSARRLPVESSDHLAPLHQQRQPCVGQVAQLLQRTGSVVCVQQWHGAHAVHMRCVHMRGALCCMRGALCLLPVGLESVGAEHELHELEPLREQPAQRVDAAVVRQLEPTDVLHLMRVRASVSQPILHVLARGRRPGACCASCRVMAGPARRESLDACSCHSAHRPH